MPIYKLHDDDYAFPPVSEATDEGLLAIGGDLSPERLIMAYSMGIFPWFENDSPILWWSLDPRMVLKPGGVKISKTLQKTIESNRFSCSIDTNFRQVITACSQCKRKDNQGTWITEEMIEAYCELHELGFAHSVETYDGNELVGGLYGVSLGSVFCGESMFHLKNDASKVAFCFLNDFLQKNNFELIDAQQETNHLKSLGAYTIARSEYIKLLNKMVIKPTLVGNWNSNTERWCEVIINKDVDSIV